MQFDGLSTRGQNGRARDLLAHSPILPYQLGEVLTVAFPAVLVPVATFVDAFAFKQTRHVRPHDVVRGRWPDLLIAAWAHVWLGRGRASDKPLPKLARTLRNEFLRTWPVGPTRTRPSGRCFSFRHAHRIPLEKCLPYRLSLLSLFDMLDSCLIFSCIR